jgi:hypothetical protein
MTNGDKRAIAVVQDTIARSRDMRAGLDELRKAMELKPDWAAPYSYYDLAAILRILGSDAEARESTAPRVRARARSEHCASTSR